MIKIKIGIIPPNTKTGVGRYSEYLISGLEQNGIEIELIKNPIFNNINVKYYLGSIFLNNLIKNKNISILHDLNSFGPFLFDNGKNVKKILTIHDIAPVILPNFNSWKIRFDFKLLLPRMIENSDFIIVPSYSAKKDLLTRWGVNENKIEVIPEGVDISFFYPKISGDKILQKYGIKNEYILYVGADSPRKNLKNLILAYSKIFNDIPHDLVLIGPIKKGYIEKIIKKYLKGRISRENVLNRIKNVGYLDTKDLPFVYSGASVFIYPSLYEGFGLPPLEAMACGTPVITSNNSSLKEIFSNAALLIYDPLNSNEISERILDILSKNKLQKKLKKKGFIQAKKFSWDKMVKKTIEVYNNLD